MQNPKLIATLPTGQLLYLCDPDPTNAIKIGLGPYLMIDPYLLENEGFAYRVNSPGRIRTNQILGGTQDSGVYKVSNFLANVVYDKSRSLFLMWYQGWNAASNSNMNAQITSADGSTWSAPNWIAPLGSNEINVVLDNVAPSPQRYMTVIPNAVNATIPYWPGQLWYSSDGISWNPGPNLTKPYGEMWSLFREGADFGILHRWNQVDLTWVDSSGVTHTVGHNNVLVRCIGFTGNKDGGYFPDSKTVFTPGPRWPGETQFYYVSNVIKRGDIYIGAMGILRDELVASGSPAGSFGTGYTTLVWSLDGVNWKSLDGLSPHFFDPSSDPAAWDHAMAWITAIVPVGDLVFLYYGGYQWGHKVYTDRRIGYTKISRDRYISRWSGTTPSVMRTKLINFSAQSLSVNSIGKVRVQITDESGNPIPGFSYSESSVTIGDNVEAPVMFAGSLSSLASRNVHIEFELTTADLYAFYLN